MNSALASLTAQYTDSENEEQKEDSDDSQNSQASQVIIPPQLSKKLPNKEVDPSTENIIPKKAKKKRSKKVRRLVSYQDDTIISDEEEFEESEDSSESSSQSESDRETSKQENEIIVNFNVNANASHANNVKDVEKSPMNVDDGAENAADAETNKEEEYASRYAHYGFTLPSEPRGHPPQELVDKINKLYDKMKSSNMDMNRLIQDRKDFRNPSIYEKLIHFCDINEFGTNYPPEIYDPLQWGVESYYEELAKVQKNEMIKRQKEKKDTDKIEQATALARKVEEDAKRRKSKWDQPAPVKTVQPPLTTTVTGTKGTVISAFGTLPKKPAA